MADQEKTSGNPNEIESLNDGALNIDELSPEELEEVAGGVAAGCTDFNGSCERFTGTCTGFGPTPVQPGGGTGTT
jgi:hypothetical protein